MKVLYDFQSYAMQGYGGISRFQTQIMSYFYETGKVDFELALEFCRNAYLEQTEFGKAKATIPADYPSIDKFLGGINFKGKGRLFSKYLQLQGKKNLWQLNRDASVEALKRGDFDIFHPTYYDPYFLEHIGDKPFVTYVYDMEHNIYPENHALNDTVRGWKRELAQKANHVIAISENAKQGVVDFYDIDPAKISVVHLANPFTEKVKPEWNAEWPEFYVLYVGHRWIYKNFYIFATAMAKLMHKDAKLHLICAGGEPFDAAEKEFLAYLGIADRSIHVRPNDNLFAGLYSHAAAFAYPSLCEGFGIPILEAFAQNCPVVCSDGTCFNEIAQDAAIYFQPKNLNSMVEQIGKVIYDDNLRKDLAAKGSALVKKFTVENMAEGVLDVYQKVLTESKA